MIKIVINFDGKIKDNLILKLIESSFFEGVLYRFCDLEIGEGDIELMFIFLCNYWGVISEVFFDVWNVNFKDLCLMYGVGIFVMGYVMDVIYDCYYLEIYDEFVLKE